MLRILAQDMGDACGAIFAALVIAVSAIAHLLQKSKEKQQERDAESARRHDRERQRHDAYSQESVRLPSERRGGGGLAGEVRRRAASPPPPPRSGQGPQRRKGAAPPRPPSAAPAMPQVVNLDFAAPTPRVHLDLSDPEIARRAILFHEILSPPKALRDEPEIWDAH